jgi:hypothetical protein
MSARRINGTIGFLVGLGALVLQFGLTVPAAMQVSAAAPEGRSLLLALVFFFSFFTILSNGTLALVYLADLAPRLPLEPFRRPWVRTMMVAVMALVTIFYHLLLAHTWAPEGLFLVADRLLHYATTLIYLIFWARFLPHGETEWRHLPWMLLPTLAYFVYILLRGMVVNEYPYPILEVGRLGYGAVLLNGLVVAIGLAALCALAIAADKMLARFNRTVSA